MGGIYSAIGGIEFVYNYAASIGMFVILQFLLITRTSGCTVISHNGYSITILLLYVAEKLYDDDNIAFYHFSPILLP